MSNEVYLQNHFCKIKKEIWDSLRKIHEGDETIKGSNLKKIRMKYESFAMKMDDALEQDSSG